MNSEEMEKIRQKKAEWEARSVKPALQRFKMAEPTKYYTPADVKEGGFLDKVGFPGEFPFTAGPYPVYPYAAGAKGADTPATALPRTPGTTTS